MRERKRTDDEKRKSKCFALLRRNLTFYNDKVKSRKLLIMTSNEKVLGKGLKF